MRYLVEVTAEDLAPGVARRVRHCPVYLACERVLGHRLRGVRGDGTVVVSSILDRYGVNAKMSREDQEKVRWAVAAIDAGLASEVTPFRFVIEVQDEFG